MKVGQIEVNSQAFEGICQRWHVAQVDAFGSVLRDDFGPDSDVDLLVTFSDGFQPGWDEISQLSNDIALLLKRKVDLVEPRLLKWVIRERVLKEARLVYAA